MRMTGVPPKGKWLSITGGLKVLVPYGAAYGNDDEGDLNIIQFKDGAGNTAPTFEAADDAPFSWKVGGLRPQSVNFEDDVPQEARDRLPQLLQLIAGQMTGGQPSAEPYELDSSTQVEETEEGFTLRSSISASEAGGAYKVYSLSQEKAFAVIRKNIQIMGMTIGFTYVMLALSAPSGAKFFMGSLAVPDAEGDLDQMAQAVRPLLDSARLEEEAPAAKKPASSKQKKKSAAPVPKGPCLQAIGIPVGGLRVPLLEGLTLQLPHGAVYYYDENQNACIAMPEEVPAGYCAGLFSLPEDTPMRWRVKGLHHEGTMGYNVEEETEAEARQASFEGFRDNMSNIANGMAGTLTQQLGGLGGKYQGTLDIADQDRMVAYAWAQNELLEARYFPGYLFVGILEGYEMHLFLGNYDPVDIPVFKKELLPVLRSAQGTNGAQPEAITAPVSEYSDEEAGLSRFVGADGRLDAFMGLAFFDEDVIFFHEEDLLWDGTCHQFAQYRFNIGMLGSAEGVMEHSAAILSGLKELVAELERNEALRIPAEDLHPSMRSFLHGADFTPAVLFYLACHHLFRISEEEPDQYSYSLEDRIHKTLPDPEGYFESFIGALRSYNGNQKPFTAQLGMVFGRGGGPAITASEYELDEDGFVVMGEDGSPKEREKSPEELAWEERIAQKKLAEELDKVPFSPVSSVQLSGSTFVLTGTFRYHEDDPEKIKADITAKGGRVTGAVSGKTNYLVVGSLGSYGQRKLEQVQEQRSKGKDVKIIREEDLVCALEGRPISQKTTPHPASPPKEQDVQVKSVPPRPGELTRVEVTAHLPGLQSDPELSMDVPELMTRLHQVLRLRIRDLSAQQRKAEEEKLRLEREHARKAAEERVRREEQAQKAAEEKARLEKEQAQKAAEEKARQEREQARKAAEEKARREQERARKAAEEKARQEKEQAEKAAAEKIQQEEARARKAKQRKKWLLAVLVVLAVLCVIFFVRKYIENAPYRALAASIDQGTFHYSQYTGDQEYFLRYENSCEVIADKLTAFHNEDDIQSAVQLLGSLPPDESSIEYYIDGWHLYMTDFFRLCFLERVAEEGTPLSSPEGSEYQGDEITGLYQLGDYVVLTVYNLFLEDDGRPEQAYVHGPAEEDGWVYLGSYQLSGYHGDQHGIQ